MRQQLRDASGSNRGEIDGYKQQITLYISEINSYKQQITILTGDIDNLKRQLNRASDCGHGDEINRYKQQISSLSLTIQQDTTRYTQEI